MLEYGTNMHNQIKEAVDIAQRAQRNYNTSRTIPSQDLDTLIYTAANSPSKQNETHYSLGIYTDQKIIRSVYNETKQFLLPSNDLQKISYKENNGIFWQDENQSVHNSQILANCIFVYFEDRGLARGGNSALAKVINDPNSESVQNYKEQISYSIGISVGQLILTAALLGYRTGICTAFNKGKVGRLLGNKNDAKLIVGIGFENQGVDRRLHAETCNNEVPLENRNGPDDQKWRFPSFDKETKILLNNKVYLDK